MNLLFELEDDHGRTLQVAAEDDGNLSVSIFAAGQANTDWNMLLDDPTVNDLQLTLATYLHDKRED